MGPSGWSDLARLADDRGDHAVIGLMHYSLVRSVQQVREQVLDEPQSIEEPAAPQRAKSTRREKDR